MPRPKTARPKSAGTRTRPAHPAKVPQAPQRGRPGPVRFKHDTRAHEYELEVLPGLEDVAAAELAAVPQARDIRGLRFWYPGSPERLLRLRSVAAVYRLRRWDVPRPRGLLGHQQFEELAEFVRAVQQAGGHTSFRISAAGRESDVLQRLTQDLSAALGLPYSEEGELVLRLRPAADGTGWEVLARLTPRPLSVREWRVCNRAGGLNASVAHALHRLAGVRAEDRIFNPMCGSGTLLVERALMGPYEAMVGVDTDPDAVACARANLAAARRDVEVAQVDALHTGLPDRSFDLIMADLPWGDAVGDHASNAELYPAFLHEMYRLCSRSGRLVVLTHELRLFERALAESRWEGYELLQVYSGGHHPKAYLLRRG
ncbi:methyltransferase domain-containing protein [Deinococcus lacus]|uniref:Methyltransferase domain-containing protein n=1 Tax=Deinococcus lacus TaxID=392561 RepID=A0ABW1YEY7_9DEIO